MSLEGFIANRRECMRVDLIRFTTVKQADTGFESVDWFVIRPATAVYMWEITDEDALRDYGPEAEGRHQILLPTDISDSIGLTRDDGVEVPAGQIQYAGRVNGNAIEGTVTSGGSNSKWSAVYYVCVSIG